MTPAIATAIVNAARSLDAIGVDARLIPDYSGRGMYGKTTAAVVVSSLGHFAACVGEAVADAYAGECYDLVRSIISAVAKCQTDSLGREIVVY